MAAGVVIVGAGQAGHTLACTLRRGGYAAPVTLLGDERGLPYQRPPLSKNYLLGDSEGLELASADYYRSHNIVTRFGEAVTRIDPGAHGVELESGETLRYDHLVLATGSTPRTLPIDSANLAGVHTLRTVDDSAALREEIQRAQRIVVVGAGFIGLEVAAVARNAETPVTVIEHADTVMPRVVSEPMSRYFTDLHRRNGVDLTLGDTVTGLVGDNGRVTEVETRGGRRVDADLVVVGVGVTPRGELAAEAGLAVKDGVVVDSRLVTTDPHISAIGDCANFPRPWGEGRTRFESVQNAADQAAYVAARILGDARPYDAVPWFWTDQYDAKLKIAGDTSTHDEAIVVDSGKPGAFSVYCFHRGTFVGAESVNRVADHMAVRRLLRQNVPVTPADVLDPSFSPKKHARMEVTS